MTFARPPWQAGARAVPVAAPTLPDRLRLETRHVHEAIERDLDWERRIATLAGYRDLLSRLYGFHAVWEPAAAALVGDEAFFGPRRKLHRLASDLAHLGVSAADLTTLPTCRPGVTMRTQAEAVGAMYVLEGSTLGGTIIARRIADTFGFGAEGGCAYYRAYGEAVGTMWRAFRGRLLTVPPDEHDTVVAAAASTFACLRHWLCTQSPA